MHEVQAMAREIVHVVAQFAVKPEHADEFARKAQELLVAPTLKEPGCIRYELCRDVTDPARFAMIETWESEETLRAHLTQPSLQQAVVSLMPLAASPPVVWRYRPV